MDAQKSARLLAALVLATPVALAGCADDGDSDPDTTEQETDAPAEDDEEGGDDAEDEEPESDETDGLPDPETVDVDRTEELGGFFSEEEACMTIGSTVDGLHDDMEGGLESEEDLEGAYEAVEQTYVLAPEDLREPLENIAEHLDVDYGEVDAGAVLEELEPLEEWVEDTCEGEYHQQDHDH